MHSSVYEGWLPVLLLVFLSEIVQVVVCIPVVRIASSLGKLSKCLTRLRKIKTYKFEVLCDIGMIRSVGAISFPQLG
jgi:hypothetical protein